MNKIANVVYPYSPKNDDELELKVGDKIEVIGEEEEGWWKGTLKGRFGVFPSNFVQVVETESPSSIAHNINKLNSIFGSRVGSKTSLSTSNSMSNINSNSNNNLNIQNNNNNSTNSTSSNNHITNNTHLQHHQQDIPSGAGNEFPFSASADESSLHSTNSMSERRPRPLRGIGFGDIFAQEAKSKPLPADPMTRSSTSAMASERLGAATSVAMDSSTLGRLASNTLSKQIPKKPPPPAPADASGQNGSASDQAPALPPKPNNQFSAFSQQRPLPTPGSAQRNVREQARVIFPYKPSNDDELMMEVDDIIDIIDKNIEDAGWWKGELNGKIGVFPDNFVQLISVSQDTSLVAQAGSQSNLSSSQLSGSTNSNSYNVSSIGSSHHHQQHQHQHHHQQQASAGSTEGKIKSVFAGTPKGFSKELESNLEKHSNNPASFLSLKRTKLQQQMSSSVVSDQSSNPDHPAGGCGGGLPMSTASLVLPGHGQNGHSSSGVTAVKAEPTSPGKLNHMTAHRAKGPTRRPPSNILNKRNQLNELGSNNHRLEQASLDDSKEDVTPAASLPAFKQTTAPAALSANHNSLASLPSEQQQQQQQQQRQLSLAASVASTPRLGLSPQSTNDNNTTPSPLKSAQQSPSSNGLGENGQPVAPKTLQRIIQPPVVQQQIDSKTKLNPTSAPSTPPWMVELRKTNAEKKRDPLPTPAVNLADELAAVPSTPNSQVPTTAVAANAAPTTPTSAPPATPSIVSTPFLTPNTTSLVSTPKFSAPVGVVDSKLTANDNGPSAAETSDDLVKKSLKSVSNDITELKNDVKMLQENFKSILGLKETVETMKIELRTCQSATESQRKYIKELVNNLADERKRIAAMQTEIDRNLK